MNESLMTHQHEKYICYSVRPNIRHSEWLVASLNTANFANACCVKTATLPLFYGTFGSICANKIVTDIVTERDNVSKLTKLSLLVLTNRHADPV